MRLIGETWFVSRNLSLLPPSGRTKDVLQALLRGSRNVREQKREQKRRIPTCFVLSHKSRKFEGRRGQVLTKVFPSRGRDVFPPNAEAQVTATPLYSCAVRHCFRICRLHPLLSLQSRERRLEHLMHLRKTVKKLLECKLKL